MNTPDYWSTVIADLDAKVSATKAELAALAGQRSPLVLAMHLGDEAATAQLAEIDASVARLNASLPDILVAAAQADLRLQAALQAARREADKARATELQAACDARQALMAKIDVAANDFVDLLVADIEQREAFAALTGVPFQSYFEISLVKSLLAFELLIKRNVTPSRHEFHLENGQHNTRTSAVDSIWGRHWIEQVQHKALELAGDPELTAGESVAIAAIAGESVAA